MHTKKEFNLHIGFDAKRAYNNQTGLGNYSRFIIQSVHDSTGNELLLFTPKIEDQWRNYFQNSTRYKTILPQTFIGKSFPSAWRSFSLADELANYKLDVFHGLSNELPVGIEKFKGKKVVTIHDLIFLRYPDYYNNIDRYIYTKKFKMACETADVVIATSIQTKNDIINFFKISPDKISVVYQNCDAIFNRVCDEKENVSIRLKYQLTAPYILCVGTIEQRKNQLTVLKAFHRAGVKDIKLVLIGRQTDYAELVINYMKEHHLSSHVQFINQVDFVDLPSIFQQASLFIYASEFEGFGIPVVEAFRSNIPVLLAKSSSLTEVGGEGALYFEPHDVNELSELIKNTIHNDVLKHDMIARGKSQLALFNPQKLTEQLLNIYQR